MTFVLIWTQRHEVPVVFRAEDETAFFAWRRVHSGIALRTASLRIVFVLVLVICGRISASPPDIDLARWAVAVIVVCIGSWSHHDEREQHAYEKGQLSRAAVA